VGRSRSTSTACLFDAAPSPVVVVADHNDDTRLLFADAFRRDGWTVVEATDGRDALVAALTQRASLLVAEARLPFIDGFTVCELLRQDGATRSVAVLMIVADANAANVVRVKQCGASALVTRGATMDMVVAEGRRVVVDAQGGVERDAATQAQEADAAGEARRAVSNEKVATPRLVCPSCRRRLDFESTHIGGTGREVERWDRLVCNGGGCGDFEYSHRTRTLRPA
jgi:DNA-binding response OmpR family regulator